MKNNKRLLAVVKNPIVYHAPIFRSYSATGNKLTVIYLDTLGVSELYDEEFGAKLKWDVPLLEGYDYKFLKNYALNKYGGFFSRVNLHLIWEINSKNYDIVMITGYETFSCWLALLTAKFKKVPIIWRGEAVLRDGHNKRTIRNCLKYKSLNYFFKQCDAIFYSCSGNRNYLKHYNVEDGKLFPLLCSVDNDFYQKQSTKFRKDKNKIRKEMGINTKDFVILFVARLTKRKRPLDLLRALTQIPEFKFTVVFVGDGLERESVEEFASLNNLNIRITGFINQSNIGKYYVIGDLATFISDYDPSPKALNEAMNFNLPILATDNIGTVPELVEHGKNGYVVRLGDTFTMSKYISKLYHNPGLLKKMGKHSKTKVQNFSFEQNVRGISSTIDFAFKSSQPK